MAFRIVHIDDELRDSLAESLDRYDTSGKNRPYYLGVNLSQNKIALLPIRSNCPRGKYTIQLLSRNPNKPNHGIDLSKMVIINKNEISSKTTSVAGDSLMVSDIRNKRQIIIRKTYETISDYKIMLEKERLGQDLNKNEIFLKRRSTLKNYIN